MKSKHPYCPFIPEGATKLIIGTMPPYRFCKTPKELYEDDVDFYYGSKDNDFWNLLSQITGAKLDKKNTETAIIQRKALLSKLHIGITDIIEQCTHINGKSTDDSLDDIVLKPINELLSHHPEIDSLIYTSKSIIKHIYKIADKYHSWDTPKEGNTLDTPKESTIMIGGKRYKVIVLYSPSPSASRKVSYEKRLSQYTNVFGKL